MELLSHPFRLERNGSAATVTDGSDEANAEGIAILAMTRRGERDLVPEFGLGPIPLHGLDDLCYVPGDMSALPGHGTATVIVAEGLECMTP